MKKKLLVSCDAIDLSGYAGTSFQCRCFVTAQREQLVPVG